MKSKLLFQILLLAGLGTIHLTLSSDVGGKYNGGTSCGSCHGNVNTATTVALNGLPTTFTPGQTYSLNFTVANSTNSLAGFNIQVTGGTLTAGSGSKVNGAKTQITHTTPMSAVSGVSTFNFSWTAPASTTAITFNAVGNAVNGNNNDDSGDQWNTLSTSVSGAIPSGVESVEKSAIQLYPNPVQNEFQVSGLQGDAHITIYTLSGVRLQQVRSQASEVSISSAAFPTGLYLVLVEDAQGVHRLTVRK